MATSKNSKTKRQPIKKSSRALSTKPKGGSTTLLTQDPNLKNGVIVPSGSSFDIATPGKVIICGPIFLPGQSFSIEAEQLGTQNDTMGQAAAISVRGQDGAPIPDSSPAAVGSTGARGTRTPGNGGTGANGT